jgi:hypothetical protein
MVTVVMTNVSGYGHGELWVRLVFTGSRSFSLKKNAIILISITIIKRHCRSGAQISSAALW